jgi:hypothetical protein
VSENFTHKNSFLFVGTGFTVDGFSDERVILNDPPAKGYLK